MILRDGKEGWGNQKAVDIKEDKTWNFYKLKKEIFKIYQSCKQIYKFILTAIPMISLSPMETCTCKPNIAFMHFTCDKEKI